MKTKVFLGVLVSLTAITVASGQEPARVDVQDNVRRGLEWLARQQDRADGHFAANEGHYPTTMSALSGMCFLLEGSTLREGKYSPHLRRCVDWYLKRTQPNGLLSNPNNPTEANHYMHGHGYALLFLACVYGEEEDEQRRKVLEGILTRAVEFCGKAQASTGGWGYTSAAENGHWDEGSVTVTQLQALRAARNAGIPVPTSVIDKAVKYLKACTTEAGGIRYTFHQAGAASAPLTAAGAACAFSAGDYSSDFAKKWLAYCRKYIVVGRPTAHEEYQNYYLAQAVYVLGDDRYGKLFPGSAPADRLTWSRFRETMYAYLKSTQGFDGSWSGGWVGPVFGTTTALTILQLENNTLPIYMR